MHKKSSEMLTYKPKKTQAGKSAGENRRLLVSITVLGSAGPIRFVVNEDDPVAAVIVTALKSYAREGRLPVLGSDANNFVLYSPNAATEALNPWDRIGSLGVRNFVLSKKPQQERANEDGKQTAPKASRSIWRTWFNKTINPKIMSH
ncbi:unnamed protein product [Cuscuta epithymum]|uniref:DUF7054 domain-containing protein n=1 Tax=Cuscuta epithymum TaxID=186058 RepID=A0AAV0DSC1_9ASTE|nr:unnamed protein product [Cuscuta epithymum]CAH9104910.1 unnamed protein product [Cuscuta epithymum]CAH9134277.1 unnamed protein product [Cuscuta epithymum]CAH9134278.1 unnamed protein product [Cuscuta epithymum]